MLIWSEIDEKRFGLKTAKLSISDSELDIPGLINAFKREGGQLFIVRCDSSLITSINKLQMHGFFLADIMLTFSIRPNSIAYKENKINGLEIIYAKPTDTSILWALAQRAFKDYRGHYHNNPGLDDKKCSEVYYDWASQLPLKKEMADAVFIAKMEGNPVGFASLKIVSEGVSKAGLLGIDPYFRGKGISQQLQTRRFHWCTENGIEEIRVETSLNNKRYINILERTGFLFKSSVQIFHLNVF